MKLKYEFVCTKVADDIIAVPVGKEAGKLNLVLKLNEESQFILKCLDHETTEEDIAAKMIEEYEVDTATLLSNIHEFVEELKTADLLECDE